MTTTAALWKISKLFFYGNLQVTNQFPKMQNSVRLVMDFFKGGSKLVSSKEISAFYEKQKILEQKVFLEISTTFIHM